MQRCGGQGSVFLRDHFWRKTFIQLCMLSRTVRSSISPFIPLPMRMTIYSGKEAVIRKEKNEKT
jgi:hypothetical protein